MGTTEVAIEYDRPAVRNRRIWGDLVPYGQVWRSGANAATTIRFSTAVRINGQALPAGRYSIFTIPGPDQWEVIFNRRINQWGAFDYNPKDDVLRTRVKARYVSNPSEWLTYEITPTSSSSAYVDLLWEKLRVSFLVDVDVEAAVKANITRLLAKAGPRDWKIWSDVAAYMLEQEKDLGQALAHVDRSLKIQENPTNLFVKAQILRALGRPEAMGLLEKADTLATAQKAPGSVHGPIQATLDRWRRGGGSNGGAGGGRRR